MKIGYARVSTTDQNLERQLDVLKNKYNVDKIYSEKLSGKNTDRPAFQEMMQELKEGDTLVVSEISRLGRSLKDLLSIVEELNNRKVKLISDHDNMDTTTNTGLMMFELLGTLAEFERNQMLERQREGIKIAKEQGKYKGRRPVQRDKENINQVCQLHLDKHLNLKQACSMIKNCNVKDKSGALVDTYGVTVPTFYKIFDKWCNENKIKKVGYMHVVDGEDTEDEK